MVRLDRIVLPSFYCKLLELEACAPQNSFLEASDASFLHEVQVSAYI